MVEDLAASSPSLAKFLQRHRHKYLSLHPPHPRKWKQYPTWPKIHRLWGFLHTSTRKSDDCSEYTFENQESRASNGEWVKLTKQLGNDASVAKTPRDISLLLRSTESINTVTLNAKDLRCPIPDCNLAFVSVSSLQGHLRWHGISHKPTSQSTSPQMKFSHSPTRKHAKSISTKRKESTLNGMPIGEYMCWWE